MAKVRVNSFYYYYPVGMDVWDSRTGLKAGDRVQVKNLPGCPRAGVMGHCYVYHNGKFAGMVLVNSLQKELKQEN